MKKHTPKNIITNDRGETLVEVMVAFIVLMIVLAMFSGSINFSSSVIMNSIELRRTSDNEYIAFRKTIANENSTSTTIVFNSDNNPDTIDTGRVINEDTKDTTILIPNDDSEQDSTITLSAVKYQSGNTVYWVYR